MRTFLKDTGMTWQEYVKCDHKLATCETIEDNWGTNLLASLQVEPSSTMSNENDTEPEDSLVMQVKSAAGTSQ